MTILTMLAIAVVGFGVAMYVVLDGFDLGVGILFPFAGAAGDRDLMINSIAPVWDGNETWLVLNGAVLYGAFSDAYGILFSAWYLAVMLLLVALVFRGVAFEFRARARRMRPWSVAFSIGSFIAAFLQGALLGSLISGFKVEGDLFAGGAMDWLTPFSVTTGVALMAGYGLLGATWLIYRTEGRLQQWCYRAAQRLLLAVACFIVVVSVWTPLAFGHIARRWFDLHALVWLAPLPLLALADGVALHYALRRRLEQAPFILAVVLFLLCYAGLVASLWPYLVPWQVGIQEAATPPQSQRFLLVGVLLLLPLVLGYTVHAYRVFRGKVTVEEGYH